MVRVLFLFLTCFRVNVARTNNNPILRAFQNYGFRATEYCRRSNILTSFLMKMGESSLMPQNYKKTMLSWKSLEGDSRRSGRV